MVVQWEVGAVNFAVTTVTVTLAAAGLTVAGVSLNAEV